MLPQKWWMKPRELYEVIKISLQLLINLFITSLPLSISQFIMCRLNPALKERERVKNYDPNSYKTVDWDKMEVKQKHVLLKQARDEIKLTGKFNILVDENNPVEEKVDMLSPK